MGNCISKNESTLTPKENRNNHKTKSFRIGLSFGKGAGYVEGHAQIGYASNIKKRNGSNAFVKNNINNNSSKDPPAIINDE